MKQSPRPRSVRRSSTCLVEGLEDRKLLSTIVKVVGNGQRIAPGDTSASRDDYTDYGPMALSGPITVASRTYNIKNSGDERMYLTGKRVSISGPNASDFYVSKKAGASVAPGGSTTFRIKFDPTTVGVKYATVTVTSQSNKSVYKFNIAARAVETTEISGGTHVATLKKGTGDTADTGDVVGMLYNGLYDHGEVFDSTAKRDDAPFGFKIGASEVIQGWDKALNGTEVGDKLVLFIPYGQAYGENPSNGMPPKANLIFETTTVGAGPTLKVSGNNTKIYDGDTTPSTADATSFGSVNKNSTIVKTYTVAAEIFSQNSGVYPDFSDSAKPIHVSGSNASEFVASGITSNGNGTVSFTVTFKPTSTGKRTARIEIPNTNPFDNLYTFAIEGTGK